MQSLLRTTMVMNSTKIQNISESISPSTLDVLSNELKDYFDTHREKIPLLVIVYLLTIIWILYLILYHSRIQGIILSHLLRRFYFKDTSQIKFDSFSISFISGSIMFRNLHYITGSYCVFVKDGCLVFRYWSKTNQKPLTRLKIQLNHLDIQFFSPIRSNTSTEINDDSQRESITGLSSRVEDTQSNNTVKNNDEGLFVKRLRSLFPAIEIKVEHGRISAGHNTLPNGLLIRFSTMNSTFTTQSPSKHAPQVDLMTLIYSLTYRNLRVQLYPTKAFRGEREDPPQILPNKADGNPIVQIFECSEGELEYEQDVPGKMIEPSEQGEIIPDVAWEIRMKCNKETKITYGPWADRQRELLWQYFLPTLYEDSPITPEPSIGHTRIFKFVRFKLTLNCLTKLDFDFKKGKKIHQLYLECPSKGSYFDAILPFSTNPDGFNTFLSINLFQAIARTSLSYSPFLQADNVHIKVHVHYPRLWNSLQDWFIDIEAKKAQVYFVFEHKNFFQDLINDFASPNPPDIYSFTPFIYNITLRGEQVEVLVPCNQGNWIDCSNVNAENNYVSLCAKSLLFTYPLSFLEFCPTATPMDLTIEIEDVLARLIIPEGNRMFYIIEGLDANKRFYTSDGIKSHLSLFNAFDQRDGCFECGEVSHITILIQILLHSSPPIDINRTDLQHVQNVKALGNRQTFHPNKLDYDIFNIEIDLGQVTLLLHGLFLKRLWWIKENLFGWDQMFHDIHEPDLIREKKIIVSDDPIVDMIENKPFDPRYFRPLMVTVRVALHNITVQLLHHSDKEACPIGFCERLCVELTTDLEETKLQVLFLPVNVYVEDSIVRNKTDQHLSTGSLQLSGLIIRGHAMLSHEGLPPERETLEYAWQMEIILGKISARLTTIQLEKILSFLKNFYLQMMEDEYTLIRSPVMDKTKWIEKLKYDVLRFSLDSVDFNLIEIGNAISAQVTPIRLCMCNMHTSSCNESLTLKVGAIQIRQLLRLYPESWLEAGSIHIPELRMNAKFDCHPPTPININEQIEFLRRHDQHSQRLHFLYNTKSQPTTTTNLKRPSNAGLPTNVILQTCACLGGSSSYYTLVQGEQFFRSSYRLSEQPSFGRSLFRPDVHVIHSHPVFKHKYQWTHYEHSLPLNEQLNDEEVFYPFDFCAQQKPANDNEEQNSNLSTNLSRSNSMKFNKTKYHRRSSSSIPLNKTTNHKSSSSTSMTGDAFVTPTEQLSLNNSKGTSFNNILESLSIPARLNSVTRFSEEKESLSEKSSHSSSTDSLTAFEEILQRQQSGHGSTLLQQKSTTSSVPQTSLPSSSWISLRNQMKMPIPKSTLLCTTYIRYLSHYRSSTWSKIASFPPTIQQDQIDHHPLLDFTLVSHGFSCSLLTETFPSTQSRQQFPTTNPARTRVSIAPTMSSYTSSNIIATEKEICLRFMRELSILLTPLMLECLTTYIEKWQTYALHPMSILDGLHFQAQTTSNAPSSAVSSIDLTSTKISLQLPKINICLLQAGLAEDNVQLMELRTPVDIVTMSLFALSCKQIQMETILSKRDQSTAGVFKIQSITGQFRRFENDFSSIENVNIHAIKSQRCRLQFQMPNDLKTHLPMEDNRNNFGFVMNEFGLQRLCFKLINNAAKQQQERKQTAPVLMQVDETQTTKAPNKQKSKKKPPIDPSPPQPATPPVVSNPSSPLSSSVFDGSIDHVWISFPEPPHHTHSTSNLTKRPRLSATNSSQQMPTQQKLFSYTRYDWNFLSTLSPTVLGWFCVINRIKPPIKQFINKREKHLDAVLAYFLVEIKPLSTLSQSKLYELFTPKTKYLLSHPVCQLVIELRKHFNKNTQIHLNLQPNIIPEIDLLKQGIREACRGWAQTFKRQPIKNIQQTLPSSSTTTSPINSILPTTTNDQEQDQAASRTRSTRQQPNGIDNTNISDSSVRRRMTMQNTRKNTITKDTIIEMNKEPSSVPERRRTSSILAQSTGHVNVAFEDGDTLRRFEPTANVNNTIGYTRINTAIDESDIENPTNTKRTSTNTDNLHNEPTYYPDTGLELAGSVEQLFKILLEYAGVKLSVTSSIEPLFEKLGQTVLASAQIKRFDVKILPNELINDLQVSQINPSVESSVLCLTNLNIQSVCRQSLEHDQLHSANVQAGIRVQRVKQEVNLSLLRLVHQFSTVVGNAVEYTGIDEVIQTDSNVFQQSNDFLVAHSRSNTLLNHPESGIENLILKSYQSNLLPTTNNDDLGDLERQCWKKLRELVAIYRVEPETKQISITHKPTAESIVLQPSNASVKFVQAQISSDLGTPTSETLLLSAFGWLIIDEIYYAASLGGLKVDGCMRKVQGSISLSQRLRTLQANTNHQNPKKYDGSLIVQIGATSLSLKETLSTTPDSLINSGTSNVNENSPNISSSTREISVLDIIIGKSRALTSLQTRGRNLTLSAVTNIGTIAMDVPLRPQEVHDLVNRAGRLITSYVQEFLPGDSQQPPTTLSTTNDELQQTDTSLDDTIKESNPPLLSEQIPTKKRLNKRRKKTITSTPTTNILETQQSVTSISKRPIFQVHLTVHCQGMTFSTTLLSTLKAQYKIGVVEGVANLGSTTSRFTAIIHEHALHFLNNNTNDFDQLPTVSSDNHVRIDFPQIRCYGNYTNEFDQENQPRGHLNVRTKIDLLKLTITADFLAQLVFVSKVIIHEINEILAKVSGVEQFHFGPAKSIMKDKIIDEDIEDEDEKSSTTSFTYKIDIFIKGFEMIGQTPSNTIVKFENGEKVPIFIKLTNYNETNLLILNNKPLINAFLYLKLSLGQLLHTGGFQDAAYFKTKLLLKNSIQSDDLEKEAYFISLTKPSFYWQPGAIDKGILFWLNYKNTYEHWNEQRGAFTTPTYDSKRIRSLVNVQPLPATINELNLMFQLHIEDLGIAIPLQQIDHPTKLPDNLTSQTLNNRHSIPIIEESSDFLVFTLDKTTISACSSGAIISSGSFEGFCFRFAENFQQTNTDWKPKSTPSSKSEVILNACCVPSGQYLMYSRAKNILNSPSPKWFLNIQWDMKGIDINIDSIIGKRFAQLIRTITSTHLIAPIDRLNSENDSPNNSNSIDIQNTETMNMKETNDPTEDDERRKRLEYEYSILGQKIAALKRSQAAYEVLKPEEARYQWLEKELLHTVKTEIQQKMKKQSNKPVQQQQQQPHDLLPRSSLTTTNLNLDRSRTILSTLSVPNHKRTQSQDYSHIPRNAQERRYSLLYALALASAADSDHRLRHNKSNTWGNDYKNLKYRIRSEISTPQTQIPTSPIREEEIEDGSPTLPIRAPSHESDDRQSNTSMTTNNPSEITSTPAVDLELNVHIQIARGSCNLYTRRDLIAHSLLTTNLSKPQTQAIIGSIETINNNEYQVSQFSLPGVDVDAHYNSKHNNTTNSSLNKRGSFYCRAMVKSPTTQIIIHPILLDFLEQTLEYVKLPREQQRRASIKQEPIKDQNTGDDHLNAMFLTEDQNSTASFPIDVVVSIFIQPCVLLFTCLPAHPMECEVRLPAVDVVFSSKRALNDINSSSKDENQSEQIIENSFGGLSFSLYMKDFKLNVYHPFSGESKVHLYEDIRSGQLQTRNALAVSIQSVSVNISRTRYIIIDQNGELLNRIQLSVIAQISKGQFEYDIRRFSEILTFPKIWYNRTLARRLFLGDENLSTNLPSSSLTTRPVPSSTTTTTTANKQLRKQACVLLAIQLKELHISMRMSNVMGKVEWNTKDVSSTGRLTLTSEGKKTLFFSLGLQKSIFQAEQGIVGGLIRLQNLRTTGSIHHELRDRSYLVDASHAFDILADAIEIRLDYMGSPTLMGRICHILLRLKDDRHSTSINNRQDNSSPALTLVILNLEWSQLHLMITRSTTPDILKMSMKLIEFFNAQMLSSKNLLASVQYDFRNGTKRNSIEKKSANQQSKRDMNVIKRYIGMNGGEIMLQGHNLTIVVFHGPNFKSRQWALFSLNEPQINFVTDRGEEGDINQKLFFYLGHQSQTTQASLQSRTNMASISKVTRNSNEAPSHLTINEWFNYASSTISAVGLRDFPNLDDPETPVVVAKKVRSKQYEQSAESIFILPALELRFQTRQLEGQVHCSFETEFYEHIMFTFNAEHFYFLHDLISSYIKEKERTLTAAVNDKPRQRITGSTTENQTLPPLDEVKSDDIRRFICPDTKWKLQPTIKLLTAYGNEVEPIGADFILQKLGFRHARLTIPKWVQRGIMDPCEQSMTIVQLILVFLLPERFKELCLK